MSFFLFSFSHKREVLVPSKMLGRVIGTNGENIKQLETKTGTRITALQNDNLTESGSMRTMKIEGTETGCIEALNEIEKFLISQR